MTFPGYRCARLPMVVVVYNDAAYGAEVHHFGPDGYPLSTVTFPDSDIAGVRWRGVRRALAMTWAASARFALLTYTHRKRAKALRTGKQSKGSRR
jgi:hypothetical protein